MNQIPRSIVAALALALLLTACPSPTSPDPGKSDSGDVSLRAIAPDPATTLANAPDWERRNGTFYQVWVSAFADFDGDGTGDLAGITGKINDSQRPPPKVVA
ncbi:MAG: hypothetical protein Q8O00_08985 [Holophaga sp.]|nr:hypothetical protein [Holophaga sp.]